MYFCNIYRNTKKKKEILKIGCEKTWLGVLSHSPHLNLIINYEFLNYYSIKKYG